MYSIQFAEVVAVNGDKIKVRFPYEDLAGDSEYPKIKSYAAFVGDRAVLLKLENGYLAIGGMRSAE